MGNETGWNVLGNKIKYKYKNAEWNQHEPSMDIFKDINQVKDYCGNFGDSFENTNCWLDVYNWSLMNKTKFTEDIYQFINHRANVVRNGFTKEIENFSINEEMRQDLIDKIVGFIPDFVLNVIEVINFIFLGGLM